jgi:hypothetical protein
MKILRVYFNNSLLYFEHKQTHFFDLVVCQRSEAQRPYFIDQLPKVNKQADLE